jgi:Holliday junction resolvase RusA-like endonuclease
MEIRMSHQALSFTVPGIPVQQGSKTAFKHHATGKVVLIDDNSVRLAPWRQKASIHARNAVVRHGGWLPLESPVIVGLRFYMPRPATVPKARRPLPNVKPDIDKLTRAMLDAMTDAKVYADDAKVVELHVYKFYADDCEPCVKVTVEETQITEM